MACACAKSRIYGTIEKQFRGYFEKAKKVPGKTGEVLLQLLETRLDNVVYRLGFTPTRFMARQLVSHGHILVDGKKLDIPSYQVKVGQLIALSEKALSIPQVKLRLENPEILPPAWLSRQAHVGKVSTLPNREAIDTPINEQLIVEFYSR